jgi:uncharacterized membrane protein YfcA
VPGRSAFLVRDLGLGVLVGVFSGLFGVGGGIILVPILVLVFHIAQKRAQATSLVMVAIAAVTGALTYAFGDSVAWLPALPLAVGGIVGTWIGTTFVRRTPDRWLQFGFAALLIVAALRMMWGGLSDQQSVLVELTPPVVIGYLTAGLAMGLLSAFMGVGGGVIVIPILVTFFGFSQQLAAGTSLAVMIPIALLGAVRLTRAGHTDWPQGTRIGIGAAVGAIGGASLALVASGAILQFGFALLLLFAAAQMIRKAWS